MSKKHFHKNGERLDLAPFLSAHPKIRCKMDDGARSNLSPKMRVGVYAGSFDPVHVGHIAFALRAQKLARLDKVLFMPERKSRAKNSEHYGHRIAMIRQALRPYKNLEVLESAEKHFTVRRTLANLNKLLPDSELVFLMGSDTLKELDRWPYVERLLKQNEICVGLRSNDTRKQIDYFVNDLPVSPLKIWIVEGHERMVSSSAIRVALAMNQTAQGMLSSVYKYAKREWLYVQN